MKTLIRWFENNDSIKGWWYFMTFNYWLVIVLDTEEVWGAYLTEDKANIEAKKLRNRSGCNVVIEKVEITNEQIIELVNRNINNEYGYELKSVGLPEDYFKLKEREKVEREIEELAEFVKIIGDMYNE